MRVFPFLHPPAAVSYFAQPPEASTLSFVAPSIAHARTRSAFEGARRELARYEDYGERWDGYFARPFDKALLGLTQQILTLTEALLIESTTEPASVSTGPASDGSLDLEFEVVDKRMILTLYPSDESVRVYRSRAERHRESVEALGVNSVAEWVGWLADESGIPPTVGTDPART